MRKPNFFIVGASRCGTTALSEYLREHSAVFMCQPKEPHFFADDFPRHKLYNMHSLENYLELFEGARSRHRAIGEASASYLYSKVAIREIFNFNPGARLIIMLRNPIEMVYSFHSLMVYQLYEDEEDFEAAWHLQPLRKKGYRIPDTCREPAFLNYGEVAMFGMQLERVFEIFPREQVKVILFDDFIRSTKEVYEQVLAFLSIPLDERSYFPKVNSNKQLRLKWVARLTHQPPPWLVELSEHLREYIEIDIRLVARKLKGLNSEQVKRPPLNKKFREYLVDYFREDVNKLSHIIERDLTDWLSC